MNPEQETLAESTKAKRSIVAACLTVALLAVAVTFLVDGALRAITILAAVAAVIAAFRGLPDALVESAVRGRGSAYFKFVSYALPIGAILISIYLGWLFLSIQGSGLLGDLPLELIIGLIVVAGLLNLGVVAFNAFSSD